MLNIVIVGVIIVYMLILLGIIFRNNSLASRI